MIIEDKIVVDFKTQNFVSLQRFWYLMYHWIKINVRLIILAKTGSRT